MLYNLAILLPCLVCLFWSIELGLSIRKESPMSKKILHFLTFFASYTFFIEAYYIAGRIDYSSYMITDTLDALITLSVLPMSYLYFKSLTQAPNFNWKDYLFFLPAIIVAAATLTLYLAMGNENAAGYVKSLYQNHFILTPPYDGVLYKTHCLVSRTLYDVAFFIQAVCVTIIAIKNIVRYHSRLENYYSTVDDKSIQLNKYVYVWALASLAFSFTLVILTRDFMRMHPVFAMAFFALWSATYYGWCYCAHRMSYTLESFLDELSKSNASQTREEGDGVSEEGLFIEKDDIEEKKEKEIEATNRYKQMLPVLDTLMKEQKLFLLKTLRIDDVAVAMHTNRTYVSLMIKENHHCNFTDYINHLRVEYAQEYLCNNPGEKHENVADKCGFISTSSFYRAFKKFTGETPLIWLSSHTSVA